MRIREGFEHKRIAGEDIIVPIGKRCMDFDGMLTLNETAVFIWDRLEQGMDAETIADAILKEYDTDRETAYSCVVAFIEKLRRIGCIEE